MANKIKVASEAGKGGVFIPSQKDVNLCWPAVYVVLVDVAKPLL